MRYLIIIYTISLSTHCYAAMLVNDPVATQQRNLMDLWEQSQRAREEIVFANHASQLVKTVATLESQIALLEQQLDSMTNNFQRAAGFGEGIKEFTDNLTRTTVSFSDTLGLDPSRSTDLTQIIDSLFVPSSQDNRFNNERVKAAYQQRAYKGALETAELVIANSEDRAKNVEREVMKINSTNQQKDSVDVLARLVGEMLVEQQKTNLLLAQIARSGATDKFYGVIKNAKVGEETFESRARKTNFTNKSVSDFTLPSGKKGYDPYKAIKSKRRQPEEAWSPFMND